MSALLVGYARCSTDQQDLTAQRDGLVALGVEAERIYVDHGLTGTNRERPGLREALAACRAGDTLVVTKLDRLARSLPDAPAIADELTARQISLSLLDATPDGTLPSAGRVAVAMDGVIGRLRFALGEYESEPPPGSELTAHVLRFPTEAQARKCQVELLDGAIAVLVEADAETTDWRLYAVYPELAPDPGFRSRERALEATVRRLGGVYSGSQSPPMTS